jgi:hypothetical protein
MVRQYEALRPHQMGRYAQQNLTFGKRLAHQPQIKIFEIAQPAVNQLGRC